MTVMDYSASAPRQPRIENVLIILQLSWPCFPMTPKHTARLFRTMTQKYAAHDEFLKAQLAGLPPLPAVERLSPTVIRILGGNPGKVFPPPGAVTFATAVVLTPASSASRAQTPTSSAQAAPVS